jgi:hypothetical protein
MSLETTTEAPASEAPTLAPVADTRLSRPHRLSLLPRLLRPLMTTLWRCGTRTMHPRTFATNADVLPPSRAIPLHPNPPQPEYP